ncbi:MULTISPECIES: aminotransferase class IV [Sphingobacterium]|uniref:branched-chain-amino-acid transaminase n=1 Tax=Sphingobacterium populi TaxID=1812824 RepID=A0ABW5UEW5_9SPHI|nr:aminotransferase class IV [Sphingobacterium sp. CFCC 11742]
MPTHYINANGNLVAENSPIIAIENRAFRYGDGVFETMLWRDGDIRFLAQHVQRLQHALQMLHIEDFVLYDAYFIRSKTEELIRKNNLVGKDVRIRLIVHRAGDGLYAPKTNKSAYTLQADLLTAPSKDKKVGLIVGLYTEYKKAYSELSKLKSLNALVYVTAGLFKNKFGYDDVLLLNQEGYLCESLTSNVFVYYDKTLYTPAISEGCVQGVMRQVVMDMANEEGIPVVEAQISPDIMNEADEIFCTNAVQGIQWVMGYKQKRYFNRIARVMQDKLKNFTYDISS